MFDSLSLLVGPFIPLGIVREVKKSDGGGGGSRGFG